MGRLKDFDPLGMNFWGCPDPITKIAQQRFYRHVLASLEKHIRFVLDAGVTSNDKAELLRLFFAEYRLVNKDYKFEDDQ